MPCSFSENRKVQCHKRQFETTCFVNNKTLLAKNLALDDRCIAYRLFLKLTTFCTLKNHRFEKKAFTEKSLVSYRNRSSTDLGFTWLYNIQMDDKNKQDIICPRFWKRRKSVNGKTALEPIFLKTICLLQ